MADINFDGLEFNYGPGNANWYVDSAVYHSAPDGLRSGVITHNQTSRIDFVNPGAGQLTYYWRTSSESNYDWLTLYKNGAFVERISGNNSFVQRTVEFETGDTIHWIYSKDGSVSSFNDAGYLDTFVYTAASSSSTSFSSSSTSFSSSSASSSSSSSSISLTPTLTTTTNFPLITNGFPFILEGSSGYIGLSGSATGGRWVYRNTTTGSSGTGPSVPPPSADGYYWYTETSGTSLGATFTMTLEYNLNARNYNYIVDFFYSNYGSTGNGECLVQFHDGNDWVTVQTIGWDTVSSAWKAATPIDLSSFNNEYGQLRWQFRSISGTTYRHDFALDDITITVEVASSSSSSTSSSSSSVSSSESLSSATWTWGQQTGVPTGYALTFSNGRVIPWVANEIEGSGDDERIICNPDGSYVWSEPAYTGAGENVYLLYNQYSGSRNDDRFGAILYRTGATRQDCIASGWREYSQLGEPLTSLGWMQFSFTIDSISSSSVSSSSSSSASIDCSWESFNDGLSDWDIYQDEGVNLASWNGSAWTSVIHHLDSAISGSEYGGASYIYLTPKAWSFGYDRLVYARITHNRNISDLGGNNPRFQLLDTGSVKILEQNQYISTTIVPITMGANDLDLFKFYHTGATPFQISNIELCRSSSSSSVSSSSSSSTSSSSSSCTLGFYETKGPTYWPVGDGVWDGVGYTAVSNGNWTTSWFPVGGPLEGTQPVRFSITLNNFIGWDPDNFRIIVEDTDNNEVYNSGLFDLDGDAVPTTVGFSPTWGAFPLYFIRVDGGDDNFYVTSIEVYNDCGTGSWSSSSSSTSSSSSSTSSSSSSYSVGPMTQGCTDDYNAFSLGYTTDGNNITSYPRIENLGVPGSRTPNNIATMWVEPYSTGVTRGRLYGCRFDGCTPVMTANRIEPETLDLWTTFERWSTYMYGEDKLVYAVNAASGGFNCTFYIIDPTTMTKLVGPVSFDSLGRYPTVWGRENYFTAISYSNLTGPTAGIYKSNWDHLGNNTGSKTHIKNNGVRPRNTIVQNGAQLLEDTSKHIMLIYDADYSGLTSTADNRVEGIVLQTTGAVVNPEVVISRQRGNYVDLPAGVVAYREDDGGSEWGFMVFWWEGDGSPSGYMDGTFNVRKFTRGGTPVIDPSPGTNGIIQLFNTQAESGPFGFDFYVSACETYQLNYLIVFQNDHLARYQYMVIDRDLNILVPLTTITSTGIISGTSQSILVRPNYDGVNYYIHGENLTPNNDYCQVVELGSI